MKKQFIRIISVIIAVLVVAMTMPLGAFAATEPSTNGSITLNYEHYVYYNGGAQYYSFYPEESGLYLISSQGSLDTFVTVFDRNMIKLASDDDSGENGNFALSIRLEKKNKYFIKLGAYGKGEFTVTTTMPETADKIVICDTKGNETDGIYAYVGETIRYTTKFLPEGSVGDNVVWSVEDTEIASVDSYGNVTFKNAGSTSLIATAGGLSTKVTLVSKAVVELVPEVENNVLIPDTGDHLYFNFTASESSYYKFTYSNYYGLNIVVYSPDGDEYITTGGSAAADNFDMYIEANSTIAIKVDYAECSEDRISIKAQQVVYAEQVEIYAQRDNNKLFYDYFDIYVGDTIQLGYELYPENSISRNELYFYGSDSSVANVSSDGTITAKSKGSLTVTVSNYHFSDQISINVREREEISLNTTYCYSIGPNSLGRYSGSFKLEKDANLKISFSSRVNVTVQVYDQWGDLIVEQSGNDGVIRNWFSDVYSHYIVISSDDIYDDASCNLTIEDYIPVEDLQIVDSNGKDITQYYGEKGDWLQLGCNIIPEDAVTDYVWKSEDTNIARVDEYGNVYLANAGGTYIYVYALNDKGEEIDYLSDHIYVFAENITDSYFGYSHYITIEDYTQKLRVNAPHSGYYYVETYGNYDFAGVSVTRTMDDGNVEIDQGYISETSGLFSFYLEKGTECIISVSGIYGESYNVQLGSYDVPNRIYITDTYGNEKTEHTGYIDEGYALDFKYDMYNCYRETFNWKSSNENVVTVDSYGYMSFLKEGVAEVTVTTATGFKASISVSVIKGKTIALDVPVTEQLSYDGNSSVRFMFTPSVTGVYQINAEHNYNGYVSMNFSAMDNSYNNIASIQSSDSYASFKMEAGKTYYIKVYENAMGGSYSFTLTNKTVSLEDMPKDLYMGEGSGIINYYFIPEESGFYLFKTSGYNDDGWGRGVYVYNFEGEVETDFGIEGDSSLTYVTLNAGECYRLEIFKNYWEPANFSFEITKAVGISSMEIVTPPSNNTVSEGTDDFNLNGLLLRVTMSDGNVQIWNYNENPQYICGYSWSSSYSEEIDGIRYFYIKAGGSVCVVPFTVKSLETLKANTPVQVTYSPEYYERIQYKFIPEKSGWYLFRSYNHQVASTERYMNLSGNGMHAYSSNDVNTVEMYALLTAGETYTLTMYKYYHQSDTFTLFISETVGIESLTVKQYPTNMTVVANKQGNPDFSGLVLTVTTSDGQVRDWTYTKGANRVFEYLFEKSWSEQEETINYNLHIGGKNIILTYEKIPYPLESIEVITAGELTIAEHTNGYWLSEDVYYYNVPSHKVKLKFNYNDGTCKFASIYDEVDGYRISYYDSQTEIPWVKGGDNYFTVMFADKQVRVPVKIVDNTFKSIEVLDDGDLTVIEGMTSYQYMGGDEGIWYYDIDYSDVKLKVSFTDGSSVITSPEESVRGIYLSTYESQYMNPIEAGKDNYITVTYGDASVDLPVTVIDNGIESVSLTKTPDKPYIYGDKAHGDGDGEDYWFYPHFSDGYEFTVKYDDGTEVTVSEEYYDNETFSGSYPQVGVYSNLANPGTNKAYFAWGGTVIDFDIELVESDVTSIEVLEKPVIPEGLKYYPDMVGLKLKLNYADGTSKIVTLTEENISYEGDYYMVYAAEIDGNYLTIEHWNQGEYRINYKGTDAFFDLGSNVAFYINNMSIVDFDIDNETVTLSFIYNKNNTEEYRTLQIDLSDADKGINDSGASYNGFVKNEQGVFSYYCSYNKNSNNGLVSYYISLLNDEINGYLFDTAGDINGDCKIDVRDLVRLKKLIADDTTETASPADFDGDDRCTATDMAYLRKCILGEARLSVVEGDADGNGHLEYEDALAIAMYLAGSDERLSSRADANRDGIIDQRDIDLINSMI